MEKRYEEGTEKDGTKEKKIKQNSRKPGRLKDETENHQRVEKFNHQAMMNNKRKQLI